MADANETMSLLNAEVRRQLEIKRDKELCKIRKLRLVLVNLQKLRINKLDLPDNGEQVEQALKVVEVNNYIHLNAGGSDDYLLGLKSLREAINLSYTERKAVREEIIHLLRTNLKPIIDFGKKLKAEMPDVFADPGTPPPQSTTSTTTTKPSSSFLLFSFEAQRRANTKKLVEARNRKCAYLKAAAELKMGPYLVHELELLYSQGKLTQEKSNILRDYFTNELLTRTEQSAKALKEVEGYLDKELEKIMGSEGN